MASLLGRAARKAHKVVKRTLKSRTGALRVALVGCGGISGDHISGFESTTDALTVAGSDISATALAGTLENWPFLRVYRDYRQMLKEARPDIVSVCTWPQSHAEHVSAAATLGAKAILCEKPMALSMSEIEEMISVCRETGTKLACGHQYRFHPVFEEARRHVAAGTLGTLRRVRGRIRGSMANNGPHLIDTIRFLIGDVAASRVRYTCARNQGSYERGLPCEESGHCTVEFANGITCELETGDPNPGTFWIEVEGSKDSLHVTMDRLEVGGGKHSFDRDAAWALCRRRQFSEFVKWARGKQHTYRADAMTAAVSAEIVLASYESIRTGDWVCLPLSNRGQVVSQAFGHREPPTERATLLRASAQLGDDAPLQQRLAMHGGKPAASRWFSSSPVFGITEWKNVASVMRSRELNRVGTAMVTQLEQRWSSFYGSPMAVASNSGTSAIHVALAAVNPEPCDEVITTPISDMGTVIPILACNCVPVFADVDPRTGNLTAETIAQRITSRTRAVILVHLFGRPADMLPIVELLQSRGIALIEDCAQAHGAAFAGKKVGTFGDLGCFSLQQSKQITCGDGGITLVNRMEFAERARYFVDKGWVRASGRNHRFLGMNFRMTELQGAVALGQLERLPQLMVSRRDCAERLQERLGSISGVLLPPKDDQVLSSWWKFPIAVNESALCCTTDDFFDALRVEGVRMMRTYLPRPLFEEDMFTHKRTYGQSGYPLTATHYALPDRRNFPNMLEFFHNWLILDWSNRVRAAHVEGIVKAIDKVSRYFTRRSALQHAAMLDAKGSSQFGENLNVPLLYRQ